MQDFDSPAYRALVVDHALSGFARCIQFGDEHGELPWNCDLSQGWVQFGEGPRCRLHLLGTYAQDQATFLWSWANPGNAGWLPEVTAIARGLAESQAALAEFSEGQLPGSEVSYLELGSVCSELGGGFPLFVGGLDKTEVLMLVEAPVEPLPLTKLPRVLLDFQTHAKGDVRASVERFLSSGSLGRGNFKLHSDAAETRAGDAWGNHLTINWDEAGRIAKIDLALQPAD